MKKIKISLFVIKVYHDIKIYFPYKKVELNGQYNNTI